MNRVKPRYVVAVSRSDQMFARSLKEFLGPRVEVSVVVVPCSGSVEAAIKGQVVDLLILDARIASAPTGKLDFRNVFKLRRLCSAPFMAYVGEYDSVMHRRLMMLGLAGIASKCDEPAVLSRICERVRHGQSGILSPQIKKDIASVADDRRIRRLSHQRCSGRA